MLLVDEELGTDPLHIAIVGAKSDASAQALRTAALGVPGGYRRIDWWDRSEGPLPNAEVTYPTLTHPAAFIYGGRSCSTPAFDGAKIAEAARLLDLQ